MSGLDVDVCRAVAAAVLGDASKVKFTPLTAKERFTALQSGEIDVLSRNTTWTHTRDTSLGLNFPASHTMTARALWSAKSWALRVQKSLTELLFVFRQEQRRVELGRLFPLQ